MPVYCNNLPSTRSTFFSYGERPSCTTTQNKRCNSFYTLLIFTFSDRRWKTKYSGPNSSITPKFCLNFFVNVSLICCCHSQILEQSTLTNSYEKSFLTLYSANNSAIINSTFSLMEWTKAVFIN
jgi:hypothetical protein